MYSEKERKKGIFDICSSMIMNMNMDINIYYFYHRTKNRSTKGWAR